MKISVIHPSRERAKLAFKTAENWFKKADNRFEYILSLDQSDQTKELYYQLYLNQFPDALCCLNQNISAIEAVNKAAKISIGDILIIISDDFDCPEHWDTLLLKALDGKSDFVLKTDDLYQPTLVSLPIMDRIFYERYGYIYYPGYKHMFCDQEMTAAALMTGKYLKSSLVFPHNHYTTGKTPKDEINVKNDLTWRQGETLFNERLKTNFGITEPVMKYEDIIWH